MQSVFKFAKAATGGAGGAEEGDDDAFGKDIKIQMSGLLSKQRFRGGGKWQPRMFVLKDGFILWYEEAHNPQKGWSTKCKGAVSLGGCSVHVGPDDGSSFTFRVTHQDFGDSCLNLSAPSAAKREEWMQAIRDCSYVTYENALLGDSMIQKLRAEGSELEGAKSALVEKYKEEAMAHAAEKERHEAVERAKMQLELEKAGMESALAATEEEKRKTTAALRQKEEEALKLAEERKLLEAESASLSSEAERMKLQALELAAQKDATEAALIQTAEEAQRLAKEKDDMSSVAASKILSQQEEIEEQKARRAKTEKKLAIAEEALKRLDAALRRAKVSLGEDVHAGA